MVGALFAIQQSRSLMGWVCLFLLFVVGFFCFCFVVLLLLLFCFVLFVFVGVFSSCGYSANTSCLSLS